VTEDGKPIDRPLCTFSPNADQNNDASVNVALSPRGSFVTEPCGRGQIGLARDCGFSDAGDVRTCAPGEKRTLSCTSGSASTPQQMRICEASTALKGGVACDYHDALANAVLTDAPTDVTFTCPGARDDQERGGQYALYAAPVFDGDPAAPVQCTEKP
jgi:hypothetical protein